MDGLTNDSGTLASDLRRVAAGDRLAFHSVYAATSGRLFGVCLRLLSDRGEAEEALQETYLTVWRNASAYDEARGQPMAWLLTLARNRAVDRIRSRARARPFSDLPMEEMPDPAPSAAESMVRRDEGVRMVECLEELAQQDSRFIRAAFLEGSTYSVLAERSAMPLGTVKSRIRRALLKLRDCLQ